MIAGIGCVVSSAITIVVGVFSEKITDPVGFICEIDFLPEVYRGRNSCA